jgi:hypothetical protein
MIFCVVFQLSTGNVSWIYFADACVDGGFGFVNGGLLAMNIIMAFSVSYLIESAA